MHALAYAPQEELSDCKTIIWNGPMGVFEMEAFAKGTNDVAQTLAACTGRHLHRER